MVQTFNNYTKCFLNKKNKFLVLKIVPKWDFCGHTQNNNLNHIINYFLFSFEINHKNIKFI